MSRIFLIPGMGADSRIYQNIKIEGYDQVLINWFDPDKSDTLKTYAQKIKDQYHITDNDIVIGNSLGGMLAVEIGNMLCLKKVILISSIKSINEAPWYYPLFKSLPIYRLIPNWLLLRSGKLARLVFGKMSKGQNDLFSNMLRHSSAKFLKWSMWAALHWDNQTVPENTYHITGNKDLIFDHRRIKNATTINGGTHIMIFDRAAEVSAWLNKILAQ